MSLDPLPPSSDHDGARHGGDGLGAVSTRFVLGSDRRELSALRAAVGAWLDDVPGPPWLAARAQLVASELATMAMDLGAADRPIEAFLRRTHSIVVIEVSFDVAPGAAVSLTDRMTAGGDLEVRVLEHLSDRLTAHDGGRRVSLASTFHLQRPT